MTVASYEFTASEKVRNLLADDSSSLPVEEVFFAVVKEAQMLSSLSKTIERARKGHCRIVGFFAVSNPECIPTALVLRERKLDNSSAEETLNFIIPMDDEIYDIANEAQFTSDYLELLDVMASKISDASLDLSAYALKTAFSDNWHVDTTEEPTEEVRSSDSDLDCLNKVCPFSSCDRYDAFLRKRQGQRVFECVK